MNVSFIVSPVTHVAEVDVYNASKKYMLCPSFEEIGIYSKNAPISIIVIKLKHTVRTGFFVNIFFLLYIFIITKTPLVIVF